MSDHYAGARGSMVVFDSRSENSALSAVSFSTCFSNNKAKKWQIIIFICVEVVVAILSGDVNLFFLPILLYHNKTLVSKKLNLVSGPP